MIRINYNEASYVEDTPYFQSFSTDNDTSDQEDPIYVDVDVKVEIKEEVVEDEKLINETNVEYGNDLSNLSEDPLDLDKPLVKISKEEEEEEEEKVLVIEDSEESTELAEKHQEMMDLGANFFDHFICAQSSFDGSNQTDISNLHLLCDENFTESDLRLDNEKDVANSRFYFKDVLIKPCYVRLKRLDLFWKIPDNGLYCNLCKYNFSSSVDLKKHNEKNHYACFICDKPYRTTTNLRYHIHLHHLKDFRYHCDKCGQGFLFLAKIRKHYESNCGRKGEKCGVCGGYYKNVHAHLRNHVKVLFKCEICGKRYKLKTSYKCHMNKHIGNLPFKCQICGKAFVCINYLKAHSKKVCRPKQAFDFYACNKIEVGDNEWNYSANENEDQHFVQNQNEEINVRDADELLLNHSTENSVYRRTDFENFQPEIEIKYEVEELHVKTDVRDADEVLPNHSTKNSVYKRSDFENFQPEIEIKYDVEELRVKTDVRDADEVLPNHSTENSVCKRSDFENVQPEIEIKYEVEELRVKTDCCEDRDLDSFHSTNATVKHENSGDSHTDAPFLIKSETEP